MRSQAPLFSQPASFWIGTGLVAEAPFAALAYWLPAETRQQLFSAVLDSAAWAGVAVAAVIAVYLGTAWLAHRLGLGE
jgi:hypothetical protein